MKPDDLEKHKAIFEWLKNLSTLTVALLGLGIFFGDATRLKHPAVKIAIVCLLISLLMAIYAHGRYILHFNREELYNPTYESIALLFSAALFVVGTVCLAGFALFF